MAQHSLGVCQVPGYEINIAWHLMRQPHHIVFLMDMLVSSVLGKCQVIFILSFLRVCNFRTLVWKLFFFDDWHRFPLLKTDKRPSRSSSVGRTSVLSQGNSRLDAGLQPHQCLYTSMWMKLLGCHANHQEASRGRTRGEPEESVACRWQSTQARESTLDLKSTAYVKTGISAVPQEGLVSSNLEKKQQTSWCVWLRILLQQL